MKGNNALDRNTLIHSEYRAKPKKKKKKKREKEKEKKKSAHMIHINLNMIFYTHVEHSPTQKFK